MKYSFMSFSTTNLTLEEMLQLAKKLGYAGVELRLDSKHAHGIETDASDEKIENAKKLSEKYGVEICCIATSCRFADSDSVKENIEKAKEAVELADKLGVKRLRVFGGAYPNDTYEKAFDNVVSALTEVSDFIGDRDITLCFETHDSWTNPDNVMDVIKKVNRKNVRVNWDIMHPTLTSKKTVEEAFNALKGYIAHVHMHDGVRPEGKITYLPFGTGKVDNAAALKLLTDFGYDGYMSGEWINWDEPNYLETEINKLREYEKSFK